MDAPYDGDDVATADATTGDRATGVAITDGVATAVGTATAMGAAILNGDAP